MLPRISGGLNKKSHALTMSRSVKARMFNNVSSVISNYCAYENIVTETPIPYNILNKCFIFNHFSPLLSEYGIEVYKGYENL